MRRSISQEQQGSSLLSSKDIARTLTQRLTGHAASDFDGLSVSILSHFKTLAEPDQCNTLAHIGIACCQLQVQSNQLDLFCPACDDDVGVSWAEDIDCQSGHIIKALLSLKSLLDRRSGLRPFGLAALRRLLSHTTSSDFLDLSESTAGEWCLQALRSSSRDTRITAARTLQVFVRSRSGIDTSIIHDNRVKALEHLQALWRRDDPASQEVVIIALTQIARVVDDEELNIILLRLAEALGHNNSYIAGLVYAEIQQLAQHLQINIASLLRPFWRTLSVVVVKNFVTRPSLAQQLCELLGMQISGLLQLIEQHALPYLVLSRNHDLIRRIGSSHSSPMSAFEICTRENNFPRILSFLFASTLR